MSRFAYEPDEKLLAGYIVVISTLRDLEEALEEAFGEDVDVNWPLIVAGLKARGLA